MGQMLRGGRSWPSERKLAAGAEKSGNVAAGTSSGGGTPGMSLGSGVSEQKAEQRLHLSWSDDGASS